MKHEHGGKSSESFLDTEKIISEVDFSDKVVIDAGCGDGYFSKKISKIAKKVYAIDVEDFTNDLPENVEFVKQDIRKDLPEHDIIYCANVLHGFDDFSFLKTWTGNVVIVEFKKDAPFGPPKEIRITPDKLESIFDKHGFEQAKNFELEHHYVSVFRTRTSYKS